MTPDTVPGVEFAMDVALFKVPDSKEEAVPMEDEAIDDAVPRSDEEIEPAFPIVEEPIDAAEPSPELATLPDA